MTIRIKREKLQAALEWVSPGLTAKDEIQQSSCVVFEGARMATFNGMILCSVANPLPGMLGAVTAEPLVDLLAKLPDEEIEIESKVGGKDNSRKFLVRGGKVGSGARQKSARFAGVNMEAEIHSPMSVVEKPKDEDWRPLSSKFCDGVRIVHTCAGRDDTNYVLTCVHITPKFLEANDRYQVVRYPVEVPIAENLLIRADSISKIAHSKMNEIAVTSGWVHFRNEVGLTVSCLRYLEAYGQEHLDEVFKKDGATQIEFPADMAEILSKTEIFTKKSTLGNYVTVCLSPEEAGELRISGTGAWGFYQETKNIKYTGPELKFLMDPSLLLEVAKKSQHCNVMPGRLLVETAEFMYATTTVLPDQMEGKVEA